MAQVNLEIVLRIQHRPQKRLRALILRVFKHLRRRAFLDDVAVRHEQHAVAYFLRKAHFVRHAQHRHALGRKVFHDVQHLANQLRVKGGGRLVEEHDFRLHRQGARNRHALLLSAGEAVRIFIRFALQANAVKQRQRLLPYLFLVLVLDDNWRHHHVVQHRLVREEVEALKAHAHFQQKLLLRLLVDTLDRVVMLAVQQQMPLDEDFSARNRLQLVQRAQIGGFTRAGRANQADDFALFDLQVDVLQDFQLAVMFGNMLRFQHERFLIFHRDTSLFVHREFLLDFVEDEREQRGDNQIENQRRDKDEVRAFAGADVVGNRRDVLQGNREHNRRIFQNHDELIADGRNHPANRLRDDDVRHGLPVGHAEGLRGFMLSLVDGLNRRADDFRAVRAGVQAERDARGKERTHVGCVCAIGAEQPRPREVEELGQREVDDEELNQQRRAAEEEDITAANLAERLKFADLAQRQQGAQNQAEEHGDGRQQDGQLCAVHQVAAAAEHPVGVVNHLPDDLHCTIVRRNNLVAEANVAFRHNVTPAGRDGQIADAEQRVIGNGQAFAGALRILRQALLHGFRGVRQHFLARGHHGRENPNDDEDEQHNADDDFCFPLPPIDPEQLCGHFSLHIRFLSRRMVSGFPCHTKNRALSDGMFPPGRCGLFAAVG